MCRGVCSHQSAGNPSCPGLAVRRKTRRKRAKLSLGSSDEARSGVVLGGDNVVGSK